MYFRDDATDLVVFLLTVFYVLRQVTAADDSMLVWDTPSTGVTESMPLGNGRLGANVWADTSDTVWLLLSHVDAIDENTNLDKLGLVAISALIPPRSSVSDIPAQPFRMQMHLHNGSICVDLPNGVTMDIYVDATMDAVRVVSSGVEHLLEATLEVLRTEDAQYAWNDVGTWCADLHSPILHADTVVPSDDSILFYHRNPENWTSTYFSTDLQNQQMPMYLENPTTNQTFGGLLAGGPGSPMVRGRGATNMVLVSASASTHQSICIAGTAGRYDGGIQPFVDELAAIVASSNASFAAHADVWAKFWSHSDVTVTAAQDPANLTTAAAAERVTLLDRVSRAAFHNMALGKHAIKFNGYGIFSAYAPPMTDYRPWGPCQWFQNIRLPYYHMLADGRFEEMKSLFGFYARILPLSLSRTSEWYGGTGAFFPETAQQSGLYASGSLGWGCASASNSTPTPSNTYIRYHREGGLELSLLALDWFTHTGDVAYFSRILLPQIVQYVRYYAEHFGNDADGKLDIFPSQALETWQCKTLPPEREDCVTNPMPEVAGLHAVLPRLLALVGTVATEAMGAEWRALHRRLPPLPSGSNTKGGYHIIDGLLPGTTLPYVTSNAENAGLYAVHPFRMIGLRSGRVLGVRSFEQRHNRGNDGWSEDLMQAALLGLANETAAMAVARASVPPFDGYRWVGFQAGIGAGGPITDHGGVATAGLRYMLMHSGLWDEITGATSHEIVLFPAWPCLDWAVDFKLHAPLNTVISGSYDGAGTLSEFTVSPVSRRKDVTFANCVKTVIPRGVGSAQIPAASSLHVDIPQQECSTESLCDCGSGCPLTRGLCSCSSCGSCANCDTCMCCNPAGTPPQAWQAGIDAGDILFAATELGLKSELKATIGNGYFAWQLDAPTLFIAGVFNGRAANASQPLSHRAAISAPFQVTVRKNTGFATNGSALDLRRASFMRRFRRNDDVIEFRWYAHRSFRELMILELEALSTLDGGSCTVELEWELGVDQRDGDFVRTDDTVESNNVTVLVGSTRFAEVPSEPTVRVAVVSSSIPNTVELTPGRGMRFVAAFYTSLDSPSPEVDARRAFAATVGNDTNASRVFHEQAWEKIWRSGIGFRGNDDKVIGRIDVARAVNASLYYLLSSIREDAPYSLSPGGLASNGYNGHTFWDCETWMFPPLLVWHAPLAKTLLQYRSERLEGAREKALSYEPPYAGAMFPWESAFSGAETCPTFADTGKFEQHITADIAFAARQYWYLTGDMDWLEHDGLDLVRDSADFWVSKVNASNGTAHIRDVIPPDEYARGDDSVYTNAAAKLNLEFATEAATLIHGPDAPNLAWADTARRIPILFDDKSQFHPEYAGYKRGQRIKQADVVLLAYPIGVNMSARVRANDLAIYENVTDPNGPAMTWGMHAIGHLSLGDADSAAPLLNRSFANVQPPFGIWSETPTGGATNFLTGAGGFLQPV